jgi:hypothetical protein
MFTVFVFGFHKKKKCHPGMGVHTPVIPATWKVEIGRIEV